jgi:hypothetical protein
MSYSSIAKCAEDRAFNDRLRACIADEGTDDPTDEATRLRWIVASADDIEAAYESALAAENPDPGGDESVITDGMILGVVQANPPA